MGYRGQMRSHRTSGRGNQSSREKKAKAGGRKKNIPNSSVFEEKHFLPEEEVVSNTLNRLRNLGNQKFAFPPYSEHFDRWVVDLAGVLSEFESLPTVEADEQFMNERTQILSNIKLELEERRRIEASFENIAQSLSQKKSILERIDEECGTKIREIEARKNGAVKKLSTVIDNLRRELDDLAQLKAGLFRDISKKAKAQKEAEANQRLSEAQKELESVKRDFTAKQEILRNEYQRKKQPVIEQIQADQKKIETLEIDGSLEDRRVTCEALSSAVSTFLDRRKMLPEH